MIDMRRIPPQNIVEMSELGAILLDNEATSTVLEILEPGDLYRETPVVFTI